MDPEMEDAAAYALGRRCLCTHQMAALFCMKWCHGSHLQGVMSYQKLIDAYLLEEQSCQISSRSNLKLWSHRLFWRQHPNKNNNKMSSDTRSVSDPKKYVEKNPHICRFDNSQQSNLHIFGNHFFFEMNRRIVWCRQTRSLATICKQKNIQHASTIYTWRLITKTSYNNLRIW